MTAWRDALWPEITVLERGWLSANNYLFQGPEGAALVDTGYCTHAAQTVALVQRCLGGKPLDRILNTHLHSDHCGGNAALQATYSQLQTFIPPGNATAVQSWDESSLSFRATGQLCPRFQANALLQSGSEVCLGGRLWQIYAAPGHDPESIILFEPEKRILISADALWERGFGVVFPELDGNEGFYSTNKTLDLIERLNPMVVLPGHGKIFHDIKTSIQYAREKINLYTQDPNLHFYHAAKVLIKFKILECNEIELNIFEVWANNNSTLRSIHHKIGKNKSTISWLHEIVDYLIKIKSIRINNYRIININ